MWRKPVRITRVWIYLAAAIILAGCSGAGKAPVEGRRLASPKSSTPAFYTVRRGETLYSIAWRYGLDYKDVAGWNSISSPFLIYPGERLRLHARRGSRTPVSRAPGGRKPVTTKPSTGRTVRTSTKPRLSSSPTHANAGKSMPAIKKSGSSAAKSLNWTWPTKGPLIERYSQGGNRGLDIAGNLGQPVYAARGGRVVYSGSGLIGYGKLIIVKHNKKYLSAYAHNHRLLVKEGDEVAGGQRIAQMGRTGAGRVKLHFEIRRDGKPVDPLRYLPRT